ncbi:conserved hypothetical protein [Methylobacterium nodulans ORS 2060]|uniref:DUF2939 domain-containing protein n=2 Tax=Methylobacterium nodulans TaxID=114616 RepID=B8IQE9_METNO|nr:conserved hypothetical protein [Methylobacterium nodulans ORS 2060]
MCPARVTIRIAALLGLAWCVFAVSPMLAVYQLARAVQDRDTAALLERVNLRAVRMSLLRQVAALVRPGGAEGRPVLSLSGMALAQAAEPVVAELVTPAILIDLLDDGWVDRLGKAPAPQGVLRVVGWGRAWPLFMAVDLHGFRRFTLRFPLRGSAEPRFVLHFQLRDWRWQLHGVDLSPELLAQVAQEVAARSRLTVTVPDSRIR